jgi:hypothetical protein
VEVIGRGNGGDARPAGVGGLHALLRYGRRKEARWAKGRMGRLAVCRLGRKPGKIPFRNKNSIFEFTKALKIYTRRFRRNFDVGVFLNSSRIFKDFRKI